MKRITLAALSSILFSTAAIAAEPTSVGQAIPITPGDQPHVVKKLFVTDCRAVRGYIGAPIDGTVNSGAWDGKHWEYPMPEGGVGMEYVYLNNDGLHLTFADDQGFNAIVVRGGIKSRVLKDVKKYDDPNSGTVITTFPGAATNTRAWFDQPVKTKKVSFFDVSDGVIGDVSFFRVQRGDSVLKSNPEPLPTTQPTTNPTTQMNASAITYSTEPLKEETSLTAIGVDVVVASDEKEIPLTISVRDPLNPRLVLHGADYAITGNGRARIVCDFPDQIIPAGKQISVTLDFAGSTTVKGMKVELYRIPKEAARPEALEYRKHILHALYTPVSEARPWNVWNNIGDDKTYLDGPTDDPKDLQHRLRPFVRDIVMTLDQCRQLDREGKDPIVRQYHQWMYRKILQKQPGGIPAYPTEFVKIEGVPEWASLVHQAWMQAREVPKWWLDNRLAPNGEFGGVLADDSDMYQNYAPFPMLERDGVAGQLLDAGARMAELMDERMIKDGVNKRSMDPLHAYEEGMNQESLVAYWFYGDPVYMERCMMGARSTVPLTMMTDRGHRHFRSNKLGYDQILKPEEPTREHGSHSLMWHPALITAWYNRNPHAMQWLTEWADGWLDHMKPGDYATDVKLPEDTTSKTDVLPFQGGWGMTGSVFMFLTDLTGDPRFVRPYTEYISSTGKNPPSTGYHLQELIAAGHYPTEGKAQDAIKSHWAAVLYTRGDKQPMMNVLKRDIEELQRFRHMYTTLECFTDRVFLYSAIAPSIAYTGGYTTRNKLNMTYAISYDGFGTDYAALVTQTTPKHLKVLLCNVSEKPISGRTRIWRLEPGEYEMSFGPDADNDDQLDSAEKQTISIFKGDELSITLPPKQVHILELKQTQRFEPIYGRADLAIVSREVKVADGKITGVAHNIGSAEVSDVLVALVDNQGKVIERKLVGQLAAPTDLIPTRVTFEFEAPSSDVKGLALVLDPENSVPEIYEGNNRAEVGR